MPKIIVESQKIPTKTYYLLIVDSSSSMTSLTDTTISGVNEQIDSIKQLEKEFPDQEYVMDFIHFNSNVTVAYTDKKASLLEHINNDSYKCFGMTALLDAMGKGIQDLNSRIQKEIESGDASAVVVIITDGEENSSHTFDGKKIKSIIEELQNTGRWTFTFVGANIDSITTAQNYGINLKNVMSFSADSSSNTRVYGAMSKSMKVRAAGMSGGSYSSEDFLADEDKDVSTK